MQEKNSKINEKQVASSSDHHEKVTTFSLLSTDSIQLWAWLEGYNPLDEQSVKSLSEDISYRCRETTDVNIFEHIKIYFSSLFKLTLCLERC